MLENIAGSDTDVIQPILTKGKLEDLDDFMHKMSKGQLPGRAVLQVAA